LAISSTTVPFGTVGIGTTSYQNFTLTNTGGTNLTFLKSKPPSLGVFVAQTSLAEGSTLAAGASVTETVAFTPTTLGAVSDIWYLNGADGSGVQTVTFTGTGATDLTANATPIALITNPQGGGNHNIGVILDGVFPPVGSTDSSLQYDTYTGQTRTEDWIGYQFAAPQTFGSLVFQDGKQFIDGGWFVTLNVQVRQNGTWVNVPGAAGANASPAYKGNDGINFETYTFNFAPITGDGIRIDGQPGGSATFISVGELRVYSPSPDAATPDAGSAPDSGCTCSGTGMSGPVTVSCGQTTCGTDDNTYLCSASGWSLQAEGCGSVAADAGCSCSGGGTNGQLTVACGGTTCGEDHNTYLCTAGVWSYSAAGCAGCSCSGGGTNGQLTVACGATTCGEDHNTYLCNGNGAWTYSAAGCAGCSCSGGGTNGQLTVACGATTCGEDHNTYLCNGNGTWSYSAAGCTGSADAGCSCSGGGTDGQLTVACGATTCGEDHNTYLCNGNGTWSYSAAGCTSSADAGCSCSGGGTNGQLTVACGATTCGEDFNTYLCTPTNGGLWAYQSPGCN
jgi:hypothetical protein